MSENREKLIDLSKTGTTEILTVQLDKIIDAFKGQYNLMIQIATALLVADVTLVGIGIQFNNPSMVLLSGIFPLGILIIVTQIRKLMVPVLYVAVNLEDQLNNKLDLIASTYLACLDYSDFTKLKEIHRIESHEERMKALKEINGFGSTKYHRVIMIGFILLVIAHVIGYFLLKESIAETIRLG